MSTGSEMDKTVNVNRIKIEPLIKQEVEEIEEATLPIEYTNIKIEQDDEVVDQIKTEPSVSKQNLEDSTDHSNEAASPTENIKIKLEQSDDDALSDRLNTEYSVRKQNIEDTTDNSNDVTLDVKQEQDECIDFKTRKESNDKKKSCELMSHVEETQTEENCYSCNVCDVTLNLKQEHNNKCIDLKTRKESNDKKKSDELMSCIEGTRTEEKWYSCNDYEI
ncbi:uncharacterized protein LOC126973236 isoform X5 [Leptidea sinapis]|uniref:uncharacterized protein LOC126973236 isoform X5 n=1 Tax=Leptidea sinapis TaxID=189913 RepID=UPI0021C406C8|nr:uncharacterized protein LOC126973236 isoform X5 [Leptidea sinapis]